MALLHASHCRSGVLVHGGDDDLVVDQPAMMLRTDELARAVDGQLLTGRSDVALDGLSIDSRRIVRGDFFLAIRGDRFDGHDFVDEAVRKGAAGLIVSNRSAVPSATPAGSDLTVIVVRDTTTALQAIARRVRRRSGTRVVAITGSVGKTTTKELAAAFIATKYRVVRNVGNLNNHIGLPLSLLELRCKPDVAVVELGMNHSGEIRMLVDIAEPNVRVWTNVAEVHSAFFASIDAIANAKAEVLEGACPDDHLVANADDPLVMGRIDRFPGTITTFGFSDSADVRVSAVDDAGLNGVRALVETPGGSGRFRSMLIGVGNVANALAAIGIALQFQIPMDEILRVLATFEPPSGRGAVIRLSDGVTVVDDSYNSNPTALKQALVSLGRGVGHRRRVAVLGEMLELGARSQSLHYVCGQLAAESGFDHIVTVGGVDVMALASAAKAAGLAADAVTTCATSEEAADIVSRLVKKDDLLLVKGSRGTRTDVVVDRLKADWA